jgi:hypothetical protein
MEPLETVISIWFCGILRWLGPEAIVNDRLVLSSERAPHKNKTVTVKQ